ncbi:MAG: oligosaccharide flippase family protein [Cyanobacteria bacterium NC_groundwater_1444_Ag_S-0.65um_54_12]|nr:oligosaccharide flippase family protein [Cyanobacteria bacterium NC_groundwater_1444_Ag_S-0.65um_54_12]
MRLRLSGLLPKGDLARGITVAAGGTALSQVLMVGASPILTRLYSPADFGTMAVFSSIIAILIVNVSWRYEMAIPLARDSKTATNLLVMALFMVVMMAIVYGLGIAWLSERIIQWARAPALYHFLWLLPVTLAVAGFYQAFSFWSSRRKQFALISYTRCWQAFGQVSIQLAGGMLGWGAAGLIFGAIASQILGVTSLIRRAQLERKLISWSRWPELLRQYRNFPLFTAWASLVNIVGTQSPPLLFASFFALDTAGYFALAIRVLGIPAMLVGVAVSQVFYPIVAANQDDAGLACQMVKRVATGLFIVSFPVFTLLGLYGIPLFQLAFGTAWQVAGYYAQYLAVTYGLWLVASPLSSFALVKGRQAESLLRQLAETTLRIGAILLGSRLSSPDLAVLFFTLAGTIISLVNLGWYFQLAGTSLLAWLGEIRVQLAGSIFLLVILSALRYLLPIGPALLVSGAGIILFGTLSWRAIAPRSHG